MTTVTSSVLSFLLSFSKSIFAFFWNCLSSKPAEKGWVYYLSEHWLSLLIWLCIIGVVVDGCIYLLRWKPYYVWRSLFQKKDKQPVSETETYISSINMDFDPIFDEIATEDILVFPPQYQDPMQRTKNVYHAENSVQPGLNAPHIQEQFVPPNRLNGEEYEKQNSFTKRFKIFQTRHSTK